MLLFLPNFPTRGTGIINCYRPTVHVIARRPQYIQWCENLHVLLEHVWCAYHQVQHLGSWDTILYKC